ncbi:MAG: hypothetical protein IT186_19090 [Acidobacteria bacterium]|nr:hypothetical protein [Acidobacteriota bacterium]MCG3192389.1 hypothetical protein [Thermoanaerobaculia bacterium]
MTEEQILDPRNAAEGARSRALLFLEKGSFSEALAEYDVALGLARETKDPSFADWIYACRATAAAECTDADAELLELKRILLRSRDPQTSFRAAYTSSRIYEMRRDFKKALFYNRLARDHAKNLEDIALAGHAENQHGNLLTSDSSFTEAASAYQKALQIVSSIPDFPETWRVIWRENLGYCYLALDRIEEGLATVHGCLQFLETEGALSYTVVPLMDLCYGYLRCDRFGDAIAHGERGFARLHLVGDPSVEKNLLYLLGEACHLGGHTQAAEIYFDRLASLYPDFRNLRAYLDVFDFRNVINLRA